MAAFQRISDKWNNGMVETWIERFRDLGIEEFRDY